MMDWTKLADEEALQKTVAALMERGIDVIIAEDAADAKEKALKLIPEGSEVMHVTSKTLDELGISKAIDEGNYVSLKKMITSVSDPTEMDKLRKKSSSPEYGIGSVHAITEDGQVLIASASGSQLAVYSYGATHLIWIVGTHKIVKNLDEGIKRIYDYMLPLESERLNKAYGIPKSSVNKILIFERERKGRITLIFVKQKLGF